MALKISGENVSTTLRFEPGRAQWDEDRFSVGFEGVIVDDRISFLITGEALVEMMHPQPDSLDADSAIDVYLEFEADIQRVAQRAFRSQDHLALPVIISADDVHL